jgi:hypothetical protein
MTEIKKLVFKGLVDVLNGYNTLPKSIKSKVLFNQIPQDVYIRLFDYYSYEKELNQDSEISIGKYLHKLKHVGKGVNIRTFGILGFIELIGVDSLKDERNTIGLYEKMLSQVRSLPDIKNSEDKTSEYTLFREIMSAKDSPIKDLGLVLPIRKMTDFRYYIDLINI